MVPGPALVTAPSAEALAPPRRLPNPEAPSLAHRGEHRAERYARVTLERAAVNIARADKRHPCIVRECAGLACLVHAGLLAEAAMRAVVMEAARRAGKEDEAEIARCIAWGLANPSTGKLPELRRG